MKALSCENNEVYIGLDVHREYFVASCICEGTVVNWCRTLGMMTVAGSRKCATRRFVSEGCNAGHSPIVRMRGHSA